MSEEEDSDGQHGAKPDSPLLPKSPAGALAVRHSPKDTYYMVYCIFFLMGISSLLPWNFFITAKQYWLYKLSNSTDPTAPPSERTDLSDYFESYISIASTVPSVLCLILNFLLVNRVSAHVRILSCLFVILVVFIATTAMVKVDVTDRTNQFFAGTLISVALVSGASNLFSGSVFGISGHFPMRISQALISGQAMGGTLSAVASIVDLAIAKDVTNSALAYFLTADVFILLCIISYLLLPKMQYSRYYMEAMKTCSSEGALFDTSMSSASLQAAGTAWLPPLRPIMRKTWVLGACVFYCFCVSIMVFPAVSSGIESVNAASGSPWTTTYFTPLTSFFLYNVADFCGRQATAWLQVPGPTSKWLPILVVSRTFLIPLLMFCNFQPRNHIQKVFFHSDVFPVFFICVLGISNGYLGTLPMIYGPKVVPRELSEATGVVMTFFLTVGLATGSALSVLIVHMI